MTLSDQRDRAERGGRWPYRSASVEIATADRGLSSRAVSSRQPVDAMKDWLLGTQTAPVCEAGAFVRDRLMTADRSSYRAYRAPDRRSARTMASGDEARRETIRRTDKVS